MEVPTKSATADGPAKVAQSAWSPLSIGIFRWVWIATVVSNIGTWFQDVAAGWLMTSLSPSPVMVSLVQAATTFPMLLLALPAGALADIVDRRRMLLLMTVWMTGAAALLAVLALGGTLSAWTLIGLIFAGSIGTAMAAPAWQAIVPELVPRSELSAAIALNSVGINISRAIGPALAGVVISIAGPGAAFAVNTVSFAGVVIVLLQWRHTRTASALPPERFVAAMVSGMGYVRHSPAFLAVLVRSTSFALSAVALWALLPLVTREVLDSDARGYGVLLGCIGAGAVLGAVLLPPLRARLSRDRIVLLATVAYAAVVFVISVAPPFWVVALSMVPAGLAWIAVLSTLQASAQFLLPAWVRARGLSINLTAFFGSMAIGSLVWGNVADHVGLELALRIAAAGLLLGATSALRFALPKGQGPDLEPSRHWADLEGSDDPRRHDEGAVLIMVEYRVPEQRREAFLRDAREVRRLRLRDGALSWDLYEDNDERGRFVETFANRSFLDHLRMHERVTGDDRDTEALFRVHHEADAPPKVTHLISRPLKGPG